jgi:hypothetical protein
MALKLGTTTASLYLGSTPVAAYLGAEQVYSAVQAVTLYFKDAEEDGVWTAVGNWWLDDGHTEPAGRLPNSVDSVVATANSPQPITASGQTVVDFTMNDPNGNLFTLLGTLTVTGMATFNDNTANGGTITGNATFNDSSGNGGTVTGNATFNEFSFNTGTVTGTATFTGFGCNSGGTAGTFVPDPPPACPE